MSRVLDRASILFSISEERLGYAWGKPERVNQDSLAVVLPILRHTVTPRIYTTFPEVGDTFHVKDSGAIDTMKAQNKGDLAVFLRSGTLFKGSTQERASLRSMIVLPGQTVDIKVRCIHASRGISLGAKVGYGGISPLMMDQMSYTVGFNAMDQGTYWRNATTTNLFMSTAGGRGSTMVQAGQDTGPLLHRPQAAGAETRLRGGNTLWQGGDIIRSAAAAFDYLGSPGADDLHSTFAEFSKSFDDVLSKVNLQEDQVGLSLITDKGCETVEVFDAHDSWKALHEDAVKRLGPNMAAKDKASVFEYKPEQAVKVTQAVLALDFKENLIYEHKPSNGDPSFTVVGLTAEGYVGEVVELDGKVIHLMILKAA